MSCFGRKLERDQRNRDRLLEEKIRVEDELRSTQVDHEAAVRNYKNAQIEHDKDLKRLAHKEEVLKVRDCDYFGVYF